MTCEIEAPWPRYTWCPQDPEGMDHYQLGLYLKKTMGEAWGEWWLHELDDLTGRTRVLDVDSTNRLVQEICKYDADGLITLLYPVMPELFLTPRKYPSDNGELNALARCAKLGSVLCLEALLELGANPDGLDCTTGKNWLWLGDGEEKVPVTPLDCARMAGQEECCFLLELYGGRAFYVWRDGRREALCGM